MTDAWVSLLAFALVVAAIPVALWLLRRTPYGMAAAGAQPVRLVGTLPLAAQQRIVTVEVGEGEARRWLVLGVSPSGIAALHEMPAGTAAPPPAPPFAALLKGRSDAR